MDQAQPKPDASPCIPRQRLDLRIMQSLRQIMQAVDVYSRKLSSQYDITTPQLLCLLTIVEDESLSMAALSRLIHLRPSTVVGIVDRLEKKGLVERKRDTRDRRKVHVIATARGRDLAATAPSPLQESLTASLSELPELEQTAIALSLERVVELMEAQHIKAAPLLEAGDLSAESHETIQFPDKQTPL